MFLVIGTALASVSIFLLGLCYILGRQDKGSFWTGDFFVGSICVPLILMLMSFSVGSFYHVLKNYSARPLTGTDALEALAIVIVSVAAWRLTGLGKKIKAYRLTETATVIAVDFQKESTTTPPASGGKAA